MEEDRDLRSCALCAFAGAFDVQAVAPSVVQLPQLDEVKHLLKNHRDLTRALMNFIE